MGDSHAAALSRGWRRIQNDFPETEITFFAGDKAEWHNVHAGGNKLVADSPRLREQFNRSAKGLEEIAADFDAYILCSLNLGILMPLGFWASGRYPDWESYRAAVNAFVRHSGAAHILGELRKLTATPVFVAAAPFQPQAFCKWSPGLDEATALRLRALFEDECRALAEDHAAIFVPQPEETLAPNKVTTKMAFAAISRDPSREDTRHCNEEYGAIAMAKILKAGLTR
ncbi:MAG TPA: hypothetical protein VFV07_14085 [Rhizomicrobium sp.]|nr:hypothetical protein [Rhizomicrobium sp.]